jgi:hypothetical protein
MSIYVNKVAIDEFDDMVKMEYEARGFLLRDTVRVRNNVIGKTVKFPVLSGGSAYEKPIQDMVKPMNLDYARPEATLKNWVAPELSDIFSQKEINFDELKEVAQQVSRAIGRRSDQIIIDAVGASATTKTIADGAAGMTYAKFIKLNELLNEDDVDLGDRFILMSATAERQLLNDDKFINSDYVKNGVLNGTGLNNQVVMGYKFIVIPTMAREGGLPKTGDIRTCYAYQKDSMGMGIGIDFKTDISYENLYTSFLINGLFKAGAVAVDKKGIVDVDIDETK